MKRSAFTLVELLIVMAVIAALISVVAPMGLNALKQARTVQVATDLRAAMNTIIGKVAAYGEWVTTPMTVADLGKYKTAMAVAAASGSTTAYTISVTGWGDKFDADYLIAAFGTDLEKNGMSFDGNFTNGGKLTVDVSDYIYN